MRYPWLAPLLLTLACGGDEIVTTDTGSTAPGTSGGPASSDTGSTGPVVPTTAGSAETTAPTSSTGPDPSSPSEPITSSTDPSTTTITSDSTTDDTGPVPDACQSDADCELFEDCCECKGIPAGDNQPICLLECDQTVCDALGVDAAICRLGRCITERLDCDAAKTTCPALPPDCPEGQLPGVADTCWSNTCVPAEMCNVVPDCQLCPADWMCVSDIPFGPPIRRCEPLPADCPGEPDCDCAGAVCTDQFTFCTDPGGDGLNCECVDC